MVEKYDLCVIGCGPGGFAGAMRALDFGKKVCIVESGEMGGAGVKWGALASKTMWELSKDYAVAAKVDRGYRAAGLQVDYAAMRETVLQAVEERQAQMRSQIETFSSRRRTKAGTITLKRGRGRFLSNTTLEVTRLDNVTEKVSADYFLIATGSRPRTFPGISMDQKRILDSDGVLNLEAFPRRLVIIGAGVIGCEYATIFSNFGHTKVYLVDHMDRVIPYEDMDVSEFVCESLTMSGVEILHSAKLQRIVENGAMLDVVLDRKDGQAEVVSADAVLISIGRRPCVDALDLEASGIVEGAPTYLRTDENCCYRGNIYAAGDVTHHPALINIAQNEGRQAAEHMFGASPKPLNNENMSTVMFFQPAVAAVGLNERACQRQKIPYRAAYHDNALLSRAIAMRATRGFAKIIVSDDDEQKILGMRAAGPQVSSMIMSIVFLMDQDIGLKHLLKSIYPHPTISEGIQECIRLLTGTSIYKAEAFPGRLRVWSWRP